MLDSWNQYLWLVGQTYQILVPDKPFGDGYPSVTVNALLGLGDRVLAHLNEEVFAFLWQVFRLHTENEIQRT